MRRRACLGKMYDDSLLQRILQIEDVTLVSRRKTTKLFGFMWVVLINSSVGLNSVLLMGELVFPYTSTLQHQKYNYLKLNVRHLFVTLNPIRNLSSMVIGRFFSEFTNFSGFPNCSSFRKRSTCWVTVLWAHPRLELAQRL